MRWFYLGIVGAVLAFATQSHAAVTEPLMVFQTQPIKRLKSDGETIVQQIGRFVARLAAGTKNDAPGIQSLNLAELAKGQELLRSILGFLGENLGSDWQAMIDVERPILGYVAYDLDDAEQSPAHLLIPTKGNPLAIKKWLGKIADLGEEKDGIFSMTWGGNWKSYARIQSNTLYLSFVAEGSLSGELLAPAKLAANIGNRSFEVRVYPGRLPPLLMQIIKFSFDTALEEALRQADNDPDLPPAAREFQKQWVRRVMLTILDIAREGQEIAFAPTFDPTSGEMDWELRLIPRANTELAKTLKTVPTFASPLVGVVSGDLALRFHMNLPLPAELAKGIEVAARNQYLEDNAPTEEEKAEFENYLKRLRPTFESGTFQFALGLHHSAKGYTLTGGIRIQEATAFEKMLRDGQPQEGLIDFDVDKVDAISVHTFTIPDGFPDEFTEHFGDEPVYFAFRKDALVFAVGLDAKERLAIALKSPSKPLPQVELDGSIQPLLPLIQKLDKDLARQLQILFGKEGKTFRLLRWEWQGGDEFRTRVSSDVWQFLIALGIHQSRQGSID